MLCMIRIAHETYDRHETETTVGHIFGANFRLRLRPRLNRHDTETKLVTFLGQILAEAKAEAEA